MNITLPKFLTSAKPAPSRAAERYRQYNDKNNGKIEVFLPPKLMEELRAKKIEIAKARDAKVDAAAAKRDALLKEARAAFNQAERSIQSECTKAVAAADDEFNAAEHALDAQYVQPLTAEQIALLTARVGEVVRVPSPAPSTALPQGA